MICLRLLCLVFVFTILYVYCLSYLVFVMSFYDAICLALLCLVYVKFCICYTVYLLHLVLVISGICYV